jgi:hypothetical protein
LELTINKGSHILKGTVRGMTIELEQAPGLPEGQSVMVTVVAEAARGDGLVRAFGSWADDGGEMEQFLERIRRDRRRTSSPQTSHWA